MLLKYNWNNIKYKLMLGLKIFCDMEGFVSKVKAIKKKPF